MQYLYALSFWCYYIEGKEMYMGLKRIRKLDKRLLMGIYHYCSLGYSNKGIAELN